MRKKRHNGKNNSRSLRANGAAILLAGVAMLPSCTTNKDEGRAIGEGVARQDLIELEQDYGTVLDLEQEPEVIHSIQTSQALLGFASSDPKKDFDIKQRFNPSDGPIALRISFIDGDFRVKDLSPDGVNKSIKSEIENLLFARNDLISQAAHAGALNAINFRLNVTDASYETQEKETTISGDASFENEINIDFPRTLIATSPQVLDQMLVHEITHLIAQDISEQYLSSGKYAKQVDALLTTCSAIRTRALEQLGRDADLIAEDLQKSAEITSNPNIKKVYQALAKAYRDGTYKQLLPEFDPLYLEVQAPQFGEKSTLCATDSLARQFGMMTQKLELDISNGELSDHWALGDDRYFISAQERLDDALTERSIFQYLTEHFYNPQNSFGHGKDGLNEQIATSIALLTSPEQTAAYLADTTQDTLLVRQLISNVSDLIAAGYPGMEKLIRNCSEDLKANIALYPSGVSKQCNQWLER